ncbi:helix-turn-helix transcriptional regulator [Streptomyces avicenniae]|uniref:helix-turn-helix transcriptional regulator n=1 Tax=Streptomyces avicenniae TaxID=500153 RepID=UPI00069ACCBE|nr:WYL domain-containing protein [Streptomyces avicenniae]
MTDTPGRLLRLLALLQDARPWPGPRLAATLGVTERTVRRDIDRLRDLGYPVLADRGSGGGYRLTAGTAMPPLLLDDDETVALAVGLRTAATGPVTGVTDSSARALAKLEQVLPPRLRPAVRAYQEATLPLTGPPADTPARVTADVLTTLAAACRDTERLRFHYAPRTGDPAPRHTEPHRLVGDGRRWYLVAWDLDREGWRTFRADRVTRPLRTGVRVPPRTLPAADAAHYVTESIAGQRARHQATLTLHAPLAEATAALLPGTGELTPLDPGRTLLTTGGDALDWLACRIALIDLDYEVHGPPELIALLTRMGRRLTRGTTAPGTAQD